ncbi:acetoacetate decarboxylase [Bosea sp. AK1]|uniref:acetoacetate decarboxylase family protein n=1 Tax=Bosea sp. AK1 TaxID=2587160 RepID=UPI001154689D|nr:acetoacetate decarboxylase family protein [Bosea sp. AK1]TQI75350.1 acetoacetate decarboxylase [Bosea sp. AK1]
MSNFDRPFTVPDRTPLFKALPRHYVGYRKLSVFCEASPEGIRKALPADFEYVSNQIEVFVMDCPEVHDMDNRAMGPRAYLEGGVVVQAAYGGVTGGHVLYEFVTTDDSMAGGREVWGYPKKLGAVTYEEAADGSITASVSRLGHSLIKLSYRPDEVTFEKPLLHPRLQVKRIPRADGEGFDVDQIILNELTGAKVFSQRRGSGAVLLGGRSEMDPLMELGVSRVIGAEHVVAEFKLGYGRVFHDKLKG